MKRVDCEWNSITFLPASVYVTELNTILHSSHELNMIACQHSRTSLFTVILLKGPFVSEFCSFAKSFHYPLSILLFVIVYDLTANFITRINVDYHSMYRWFYRKAPFRISPMCTLRVAACRLNTRQFGYWPCVQIKLIINVRTIIRDFCVNFVKSCNFPQKHDHFLLTMKQIVKLNQ